MAITISGLGSGLDTNALIDNLMAVQRQPLTALQGRQTAVNQATAVISSFSSKLSALATAARALDSTAEFNATAATSSDTASVTASTVGTSSSSSRVNELRSSEANQASCRSGS